MIQHVIVITILFFFFVSDVSSCPTVPIKIFIQGGLSWLVAIAVSLCLSTDSPFCALQLHPVCFGFFTASVYST